MAGSGAANVDIGGGDSGNNLYKALYFN